MNSPVLTLSARRHIRLFLQAIRPDADVLDRRFLNVVKPRKYDPALQRATLAISPVAASRLRSTPQFLEQVEYNGRRLAKLNIPMEELVELLDRFDQSLARKLSGRFEPAREQLRLATRFALSGAFYEVRESEARAFFGLYRAEAEAEDLEDLLRRFIRTLTRAFHAKRGLLVVPGNPRVPELAEPLYIEHGQPQEQLVEPSLQGRCSSYWSYPLGDSGVIQFGFPTPYPWLPRELTLLGAAANRCLEAIDRARLRDEVRRLEAEASRIEHEERHRIGRELHDEAGQSLLVIRLRLEMLERLAPPELRAGLAEVREVASQTVVELRRIIAALSPSVLERLGLKQALQQVAARFRKVHQAHVQLRIGANTEAIPMQMREVIYRVAQESLQNVARHSHATEVKLYLRSADKRIRLSVRDNGAGFAAAAGLKPSSFGLAGMRERAALLGGKLTLRSEPGKGVTVTLDLPMPCAAGRNGINGNV